ncbi:Peptidyl-prolyl cis-trans isomerase-like 4 [Mycoemilia scoparia]|uniref:Peptidyl-prolyl cis-trans isomerase n=1 Tax=Mycoemilia scoparia TaxID=417184 RepID=A0A9W8DN15_9FUNG|nr:Peptidyl-prolyl cis-trans isomerase-like 4 [Mycoemilia scoparia]
MSVLLETSVGDIVIDLHTQEAPNTCLNFLKLCKVKYYNFCAFHRVEQGFIAQSGDPTCTGKGGESIFGILEGPHKRYFPAEINPKLKHNKRGTVAMAVSGTGDTQKDGGVSGSQFYITLADNLTYLDGRSTVFGQVAEGFEALDKLSDTLCDDNNRPFKDIRIKHTIILDDPFDDPKNLQIPDESPLPTKEQMDTVRIGENDDLETEFGIDPELLEKANRERDARAQALTLEMIGDLPFAEIKPPENILFVCKLNPITRDEDLELIFSRFGEIRSCEIIRDKKTGDSLQYAFIEFENQESCEEAYFKMDNVLIDDRRIHVDFSQSVSKLHKDWMKERKHTLAQDAIEKGIWDPSSNLEFRKRYREGGSSSARRDYDRYDGKGYDMVFDSHSDRKSRNSDRSRSRDRHRSHHSTRDIKYRDGYERKYDERRSSKRGFRERSIQHHHSRRRSTSPHRSSRSHRSSRDGRSHK